MAKKDLDNAKKNEQDCFYTQIADIEYELSHYKKHFKNKVVLCNCDDPYESNFFKYFAINFNLLGLKELICTCYNDSPIAGQQLSLFDIKNIQPSENKKAYVIRIKEVDDYNNDGAIDLTDVDYLLKNKENTLSILNGNGDFASKECIEYLKYSDICCSNPPFSLLREYISLLNRYNKKFLFIANQNAITYSEVFPLIKENKLWLGYKYGDMKFRVPDYYEPRETRFWIDDDGNKWRSLGNICWFTNLDIKKRHDDLTLYKKYTPDEYPKYDNFNAINVNKVAEIPYDYDGLMGVPITFMAVYNPDQFEIVDALNRYALLDSQKTNDKVQKMHSHTCNIEGKATYFRIVIRRRNNAK